MKTKILISVLAIVAIAGCTVPGVPGLTTGPTVGAPKGLEITSFIAEPTPVYSRSTVRVVMETENQGGATSYNGTSFAYLTGSNINLTTKNGNYWYGRDPEDEVQCKYFNTTMKPADEVRGTPGDIKTFKWDLIAPNVTEGQTRSDSFIGRIYTDYETSVNGNIWVYSETEADASKANNKPLNKATFTSTSGPVAVEVSANPDPVIVYGSDKAFSLIIKISNNAQGTIYQPNVLSDCDISLTSEQLNQVNVTIDAPDFSGQGSCEGAQELISGRPTSLFCELTVNGNVATFQSYPISVRVKYGYYTQQTASVLVQGR